ncbi:unnamed protein product [Cochlearia groenlandica]
MSPTLTTLTVPRRDANSYSEDSLAAPSCLTSVDAHAQPGRHARATLACIGIELSQKPINSRNSFRTERKSTGLKAIFTQDRMAGREFLNAESLKETSLLVWNPEQTPFLISAPIPSYLAVCLCYETSPWLAEGCAKGIRRLAPFKFA